MPLEQCLGQRVNARNRLEASFQRASAASPKVPANVAPAQSTARQTVDGRRPMPIRSTVISAWRPPAHCASHLRSSPLPRMPEAQATVKRTPTQNRRTWRARWRTAGIARRTQLRTRRPQPRSPMQSSLRLGPRLPPRRSRPARHDNTEYHADRAREERLPVRA